MLIRRLPSLLFLLVLFGSIGFAQESFTLTREEAPIPEGVSQAVQAEVSKQASIVASGDQVLARFWLVSSLSAAASPSSELGVTFGALKSGSLVGVMEVVSGWSDYKENSIPAGIYTLRYGVMPADGNHMGVSVYRDYLLLVPAASDTDPAQGFGHDQLVEASMDATGVPHPAVLALFPIWDEISEPQLVKNEMDQWTLAVKFGDQTLGLVVKGHGES